MNSRARIAFIGNCQAQSLESLSGHLGVPIDVVSVPPVFDIPAFNRPEVFASIRSCDFVFNQRVSESYPIEFIRPSALAAEFGSRSVSWPNIYFDGYFPQIEYVYTNAGKIVGPLSDYHFGFVRRAWADRQDLEQLYERFMDGDVTPGFTGAPERSLHELRIREAGLSVRMSDLITARWRHRKCLYTMNHPVNEVLRELLRRLLAFAEIPLADDDALLASYPYPLSEICIPAFPAIHRSYGLSFPRDDTLRGKAMEQSQGRWQMRHEAADYTWLSLFRQFFALYDLEAASSSEVAALLGRTAG